MSHYETLEVAPTATHEEILSAYRRLALQCHPDKNPDDPGGATKKFKKIVEAFEVLSNIQKRQIYDAKHPSVRRSKQRATTTSKPPNKSHADWVAEHDPNLGNIRDAAPPLRDIWGNPLTPEQRRQWVEDNKADRLKYSKRSRHPHQPHYTQRPKSKSKEFIDVMANQYLDNTDVPNIR